MRGEVNFLKKELNQESDNPSVETESSSLETASNGFLANTWYSLQGHTALPSRFNGQDPEYPFEYFRFAVETFFENNPVISGDFKRISFIGTLISGEPGRWWSTFGTVERGKHHATVLN